MAPGNWEFLYPKDHLLDLIDQADFPVVAYNVTDKEWGDPVFTQYVIKQVGKLRVAVIGLTYPWTALTSSIAGAAQWWKFGIKEHEAKELVDEIRKSEKPDLIVRSSGTTPSFTRVAPTASSSPAWTWRSRTGRSSTTATSS
jgi:sulfur-oxidizing protein SoxB